MITGIFRKTLQVGFSVIGGILGKAFNDWFVGFSLVQQNTSSGYRLVAAIVFIALGVLTGYLVSSLAGRQLAVLAANIEELSTAEKLATVIGVGVGVALAAVLVLPLPVNSAVIKLSMLLLFALALAYLSVRIFLSMKEEIFLIWPSGAAAAKAQAQSVSETAPERIKILDTNVIIDGRIADICRTGFVEGPIYVPGCVLEELHHIADSAEPLKRARGRRGLDILNQLQKDARLLLRTYDHLIPEGNGEVDYRLVQLAKNLDAAIITNDFNLNKVAELEGVTVLNVNELANALKPVVLPGEEMSVTLIREGKEQNQGVAYLEDGTMVVVEGGRRHIGETLDVAVTSVLQTVAGKMIFAEVRGVHNAEDESAGSVRGGGSGGGQRRKGR